MLPAVFLVIAGLSPLQAKKAADGPAPLSADVAERLTALPQGLAGQPALVLRYKHVDTVQFYGAGQNSKFSFRRGTSLIPEGLSLRLRNEGNFSWASGSIKLRKPLDVSRYDSIVVWVRSTHPGLRFWIGVQDETWKSSDQPQARTDVLPLRGFPKEEPVQLVVPFRKIFSTRDLDYEVIDRVAFEFGQDTVGNQSTGDIDILGIAFVKQKEPVKQVRMVRMSGSSERIDVASSSPSRPATAGTRASAAVSENGGSGAARTKAAPVAAPREERTAAALLRMSDEETASLFKRFGLDPRRKPENRPTWDEAGSPAGHGYERRWISPYARYWPDAPPPEVLAAMATAAHARSHRPSTRTVLALIAIGALITALLVRRRKRLALRRLPKVLFRIRWPFPALETPRHLSLEAAFWKGVAARGVRIGWLSAPAGLAAAKGSVLSSLGFFRRQVRAARNAKVEILPSLSFLSMPFNTHALYRFPSIFHVRSLPSGERSWPDEDLIRRYRDAFPVAIPAWVRKRHPLPARILIERRPRPNQPPSNAVGLNLLAPELRAFAIQALIDLGRFSAGVRIEDASVLTNKQRARTGKGAKARPTREFWAEVIGAVKSKRPGFLFVAGGPADDPRLLREVGFDYFEHPALLQAVRHCADVGDAGPLVDLTGAEQARVLKYAIQDLNVVVDGQTEFSRAQLMAVALAAYLPGSLQHDGRLPADIARFVQRMSRSLLFRRGHFSVLPTAAAPVFSFARWRRRSLCIVAANFGTAEVDAIVRLDPIRESLNLNRLYVFQDGVRGGETLRGVVVSSVDHRTFAHWGQSLRDNGFRVAVPGLSVRLISVNLTHPVSNDTPTHVQQLHKA